MSFKSRASRSREFTCDFLFCLFSMLCCDMGGVERRARSFVEKSEMRLIQRTGVVGADLRGAQWSKILTLAGAHV